MVKKKMILSTHVKMKKIVLIILCILAQETYELSFCLKSSCIIQFTSSDFKSSSNVNIMDVKFVDSDLETFPNQLFATYPELKKCNISESMLKNLDINRETKLEWLDASRNQISELSAVTMKNIRGIVSLYLSRNKITVLKPYLFDDLTQLEVLDLSHNQITYLDSDIFAALTSLRFLYFDHNYLTQVYLNLSKADNLTEVYGGHNQIVEFDIYFQSGYKGLLNLEFNHIAVSVDIADVDELILDGNGLSSLILKGKPTKVSVNSNQIKSIEISPKMELEVLLLRDNLLTDIRNITEIVSIQVLDISYNPIEAIEENAFNKLTNLVHLSLRNTGLLISKVFLPAQRKLTHLDISENRIKILNLRSLKYLVNLETLKIENCSIESIENYQEQKEILPTLKSVAIDGNKLLCSFVAKFLNYCWRNKIEFLSDPISADKRTPNIMGISCIGIKKLNREDGWQDIQTVASDLDYSSTEPDKSNGQNQSQLQDLDQPTLVPELNKSSLGSSIEPDNPKDQNHSQQQDLDQPTSTPELNKSSLVTSIIPDTPKDPNPSQLQHLDQPTLAPELNKSSLGTSIKPDKPKDPNQSQLQDLDQPTLTPELNKSPLGTSTEPGKPKDQNQSQLQDLGQPTLTPELNKSTLVTSIEPDNSKDPNQSQPQDFDQPTVVPELNNSSIGSSIEPDKSNGQNQSQLQHLDQPTVTPEVNKSSVVPSIIPDKPNDQNHSQLQDLGQPTLTPELNKSTLVTFIEPDKPKDQNQYQLQDLDQPTLSPELNKSTLVTSIEPDEPKDRNQYQRQDLHQPTLTPELNKSSFVTSIIPDKPKDQNQSQLQDLVQPTSPELDKSSLGTSIELDNPKEQNQSQRHDLNQPSVAPALNKSFLGTSIDLWILVILCSFVSLIILVLCRRHLLAKSKPVTEMEEDTCRPLNEVLHSSITSDSK